MSEQKDKASASADLDGIARDVAREAFQNPDYDVVKSPHAFWKDIPTIISLTTSELRNIIATALARATAVDEKEKDSMNETLTPQANSTRGDEPLLDELHKTTIFLETVVRNLSQMQDITSPQRVFLEGHISLNRAAISACERGSAVNASQSRGEDGSTPDSTALSKSGQSPDEVGRK